MNSLLETTLPDGTVLSIPVRISARCRRMSLRCTPSGFELVLPCGISEFQAMRFFESSQEWLASVYAKRQAFLKLHPVSPPVLPDSVFLAFTGETFPVQVRPIPVSWAGAKLENGNLILSGRAEDLPLCFDALRGWLIRHAERNLLPYAAQIAENHGFSGLTRLRTGIQKRSWGTCTRQGVVTLNAALLFFTKPLTEYVILHEFCHLTELNHSKRFWTLLESVYPNAKEARESLKSAAELLPRWVNA